MKTNNNTSEIRSGFLILVSFLTLLSLIFWSGNFQFLNKTKEVRIVFNYISGLEKNAPVHVAGHQVGKVTDIQFIGSDAGGVMVTATISGDVALKQDAEAYLNVAGFMGEMFVELFTGSRGAPPLEITQTLRGTDPIPLMELIKKGAELTERFETITASLENLVGNLDGIVGHNTDEMNHIFENLDITSENLKDMTQDLKYHPWKLLRKGKERSLEEITQQELSSNSERLVTEEEQNEDSEIENDEDNEKKKRFVVF